MYGDDKYMFCAVRVNDLFMVNSGYVATYGNKRALYATVEQLLRTNLSAEMSTQ